MLLNTSHRGLDYVALNRYARDKPGNVIAALIEIGESMHFKHSCGMS